MARNDKRNRNITAPFAREGKTLDYLEKDAESHNMERLIGVLLALRVGEYYEALYEGRILPKGLVYNGVSVVQVGVNGHQYTAPAAQPASPPAMPQSVPTLVASTPESNAVQLAERPAVIADGGDLDDDDIGYFLESEE